MENEKFFVTRDINLASTLLTLGFPLIGIDFQIEGERLRPVGYFKFKETADVLKAERLYSQKGLSVEPREFSENLRYLKSEVNNPKKNPYSEMSK